jgi:hypothetical protein
MWEELHLYHRAQIPDEPNSVRQCEEREAKDKKLIWLGVKIKTQGFKILPGVLINSKPGWLKR